MGFFSSTWRYLEDNHPRYLGRLIAVLVTFLTTIAFYSAKKVTSLDGMNLGYYRGISQMVGAFCVMSYNKVEFFPSDPETGRLMLIKMAIAGIAVNVKFTAVKINPLQKFIVIMRSESILTVMLGVILFGEAMGKVKLTAAALSFIGIILVVDPTIFGFEAQTLDSPAEVMTTSGFLIALAGATIGSGNKIFVGKNARKFDSMQNLMWSGCAVLISGALLNLLFGTGFMWPAVEHIPWILAGSLASAFVQTLNLISLRYERPSFLAIIANLSVVWIFAVSMLVEGESFNEENALGGFCVVFGTVMIVLKKPVPYQGGGAPAGELPTDTGKLEILEEQDDLDDVPDSKSRSADIDGRISKKSVKYGIQTIV
jgi:drug/metabolite transporter (DMT)-like permease